MMHYDYGKHRRRNIRLKGYDYSQAGSYFVTICTRDHTCLFGKIVEGEMQLNTYGEIVATCWQEIAGHFPYVTLDTFTVMPNHMHGILGIIDVRAGSPRPDMVGVQTTSTGAETAPLQRPTLGQMIAWFKYQSTKQINTLRRITCVPVWQRNYFEHVIRSENSLHRIREYILTNPLRWHLDRENPNRVGEDEFDRWLKTL